MDDLPLHLRLRYEQYGKNCPPGHEGFWIFSDYCDSTKDSYDYLGSLLMVLVPTFIAASLYFGVHLSKPSSVSLPEQPREVVSPLEKTVSDK